MLSVILPAYNEENMIEAAAAEVSGVLSEAGIAYEILFVDDGSKDGTWEKIVSLAENDIRINGLHLSRNFGKEAAMFAGLEKATGDCVVIMDCDLQHPPETIVSMYRLWEQGFEVVEGKKENRGAESSSHRFAARSFYKMISRATGFDMMDASDFKLLDRKVVDALNALPEKKVFFRALSYWVGYKRIEVSYQVRERAEGKSKWTTWQLIKYAVSNAGSFSSLPLQIITVLGIIMLAISVIFGVISLVQKIAGVAATGFTTVILLILFSSSLIMISLGIIGYYISRIFDELKGRPRYLISETCGKNMADR